MRKDLGDLNIPDEVSDIIDKASEGIGFGSVTLVVQDSRVIQLEKVEKIRLNTTEPVKGMKYGQVVIVIQKGKIVQIERTEKQRFTGVEGKYGDGI